MDRLKEDMDVLVRGKWLSLCIIMACLVLSCASSPPAPAEWRFEKGAIDIRFQGADRLNLEHGAGGPLLICVYQLKETGSFDALAGQEDGLYKLLECSPFDHMVANCRALTIRPGENMVLTLDRERGARFLAVVAGYRPLSRASGVRVFEIPVATEVTKSWLGLKSNTTIRPGSLHVTLNLGPEGLDTN